MWSRYFKFRSLFCWLSIVIAWTCKFGATLSESTSKLVVSLRSDWVIIFILLYSIWTRLSYRLAEYEKTVSLLSDQNCPSVYSYIVNALYRQRNIQIYFCIFYRNSWARWIKPMEYIWISFCIDNECVRFSVILRKLCNIWHCNTRLTFPKDFKLSVGMTENLVKRFTKMSAEPLRQR